MLFKIFLSTVIVSFLSGNNLENCNNAGNKNITVIGIAENDKDAAIVRTGKGHHYIVNGLDKWDEKYYHKKVKVSGKLVIEEHKRLSTDSIQVQERVGIWRIIKNPKWSLAQ